MTTLFSLHTLGCVHVYPGQVRTRPTTTKQIKPAGDLLREPREGRVTSRKAGVWHTSGAWQVSVARTDGQRTYGRRVSLINPESLT